MQLFARAPNASETRTGFPELEQEPNILADDIYLFLHKHII